MDPSQPPTLQRAVLLGYIYAVLGLFTIFSGLNPVLLVGLAVGVGGYGIANDKKWGYITAVVGSFLNLLLCLNWLRYAFGLFPLVNTAVAVVLMVLLLHPQSREYQRIWFR